VGERKLTAVEGKPAEFNSELFPEWFSPPADEIATVLPLYVVRRANESADYVSMHYACVYSNGFEVIFLGMGHRSSRRLEGQLDPRFEVAFSDGSQGNSTEVETHERAEAASRDQTLRVVRHGGPFPDQPERYWVSRLPAEGRVQLLWEWPRTPGLRLHHEVSALELRQAARGAYKIWE
jgi:hypothetical protein